MIKIAVLVGSLRAESINRKLAQNLEALTPAGTEFIYADVNLPLFNQDIEASPPVQARTLKNVIESADGVLILTPEYNRGIPGVLKNAVDWASRPYGQNSFKGKPVGIVGASGGQTGTAQAQSHVRNTMIYLDTKIMGQPELYVQFGNVFDENGQVLESYKQYLQNYINALVAHIDTNKK
ncbi:MAG TPA: NADPH-dependent FMN reductase [Candidatus Saccharimonadales bacterium]|nr:NADPH-dependent FMN reductase [Candidatus Saccharimonadales bacterium]